MCYFFWLVSPDPISSYDFIIEITQITRLYDTLYFRECKKNKLFFILFRRKDIEIWENVLFVL